MAPIKFEEHVKAQLEKREIKPSQESWQKLSARLDKSDSGKGRKLWLGGIAAVLVVILTGSLFIKLQKVESVSPIVNEEQKEKIETRNFPKSEIASEEKNVSEKIITPRVKENDGIADINKENSDFEKNINNENYQSQVVQNDREKLSPISLDPVQPLKKESAVYTRELEELLAKVAIVENEKGTVTDAEINQLLSEAVNQVDNKRLFASGKIEAKDLLADVEFEIDQSFRKEVFDFLKEEFKKARTALATRNE